MNCERFTTCVLVFLIAACSRETPAPDGAEVSSPPKTTTTAGGLKPAAPTGTGSYTGALTWMESNRGFHFVIEESGVRAEGDMFRPSPTDARVRMTVGGTEWLAFAGRAGITWHRRSGSKWERATAPPTVQRVYQRVTLAIDPAKKEGQAQLVEPGHYRFTEANSGDVHDVWLDEKGRIKRITIGQLMELEITNHDLPAHVPLPHG